MLLILVLEFGPKEKIEYRSFVIREVLQEVDGR